MSNPDPNQAQQPRQRASWWAKCLIAVSILIVLLALVVLFFPWDWLRGPVNRYVSEKTGRRFEITRHLNIKPGWTTRVIADGLEFANPEWAKDELMVNAKRAEIDIELLPLLSGTVNLPRIFLSEPQLSFQMEPDGRRNWALGKNTADTGTVPSIGQLLVDNGQVHFIGTGYGAEITSKFSLNENTGQALPLTFEAKGRWQKLAFKAGGQTGGVLKISEIGPALRFPLDIYASAGATTVKVKGSMAALRSLDGVDADFELRGQTLDDLYKVLGVVLPNTPPYVLRGKLSKNGAVWNADNIRGQLGSSDLSGNLSYDQSAPVALLSGKVQSNVLDFEDLGPLIGLSAAPKISVKNDDPAAPATPEKENPANKKVSTAAPRITPPAPGKVLPRATLDLQKLRAMNANVSYQAFKIRHSKEIPLDKMRLDVTLKNGDLKLDNLNVGIAGGTVSGLVYVDTSKDIAAIKTRLDARGLQLNQLFPAIERTKGSLGKLTGKVDLQGGGNSVAQMLATSNGSVAMMMGSGEFSNLLLEFMGLDGAEIIKFLVSGDRNVQLRCAAVAFDVKQGVMESRTVVLDTADTVVTGSGQVNLADETMDMLLKPSPKDASFLSLRSPLTIKGTFASPSLGVDKGAIAVRAGLALVLGAVNPLLALAATIETGPGTDTDCQQVLSQAGQAAPSKPVKVR